VLCRFFRMGHMNTPQARTKARLTLGAKFQILTISLIVVTSLITLGFIIHQEISNSYQELLNRGSNIAKIVAQNSEYAIYAEDNDSLSQLVESLAKHPDIAYVSIMNQERRPLAGKIFRGNVQIQGAFKKRSFEVTDQTLYENYVNKKDGRRYINTLTPVVSRSAFATELFLENKSRIRSRIIGYIQLGLTDEEVRKRIQDFVFSTSIITAFILCIGIFLVLVMTKRITSPIKELASAAQDISEGRLDHEISIKTRDEIADLAQAFQRMLGNLRTYRHQVEERTAELTETNELMKQEIAERRRTEEALAAEKERLAVTLRNIGDGVITTDIQGRVFLMNKAAEELTGWSNEESYGKYINEVFYIIDTETRRRCDDPVDMALSFGSKREFSGQIVLIARDGTERMIDKIAAPIRDQESNITGVVLAFHDVTEQRKMQEELLRTQKLESVGLLAGGIAHDFNNLLTAILGNVNLAKVFAEKGENVIELLTEAENASLRAKDLTQQLLTFSRGGAPVKKAASISDLIRDTTRFVLRGSNVRCVFSIPEDLYPVCVDEGQISQVINNLIINADQAMPEGGEISVRAENTSVKPGDALPLKAGEYVKITIKDQGCGIPEKHLAKIYDPYFTTKQKGNGLGLATVHSIVKKHDGYIGVESGPDVGATFYFYLPASPDDKILTKKKEAGVLMNGGGKILVMDDEEIVRKVAGAMLGRIGYEVSFAKDGREAIESYQALMGTGQAFDVVIMDLTIPGGMGGKETIKKLLEIDPQVKAIVSSGYSNDPVMADFRNYGFSDVIVKPYEVKEVGEVLHRVLGGGDR